MKTNPPTHTLKPVTEPMDQESPGCSWCLTLCKAKVKQCSISYLATMEPWEFTPMLENQNAFCVVGWQPRAFTQRPVTNSP